MIVCDSPSLVSSDSEKKSGIEKITTNREIGRNICVIAISVKRKT
jgi:hypothetical protein